MGDKNMRIDQLIPSMRHGSDIGDMVLVVHKLLGQLGYQSEVFTESAPAKGRENCIYHMLSGSSPGKALAGLKLKRTILFYHGMMPAESITGPGLQAHRDNCRRELRKLKNHFSYALTTTNYLAEDLQEAGYQPVAVLPMPLDLQEYNRYPHQKLLRQYRDDHTNILFVGPIVPNRKLENTISVFNYYHKKINPRSRLFLVGNFSAHPDYCQKLLGYIKELEIKNVFMTGRVSFRQLLSYYRLSRVFLSLSQYEGFSIPLVEAMYMKVPVIALNRAAVPEILGGAGCLIDDDDVRNTARLLDDIVNDRGRRHEIIRRQSQRARDFLPEKVLPMYRMAIKEACRFGY
jgi:glycosyltransferase involved in cell wall biosynthesis